MKQKVWARRIVQSPYFFPVVIVALVLIAYRNVFSGQFLFDDEFLIERNSFLRSWAGLLDIFRSSSTGGAGQVDSFYRPMQGLVYWIVFQVFGPQPWAFHLLNVTLHATNGVLVYMLGRRLRWASLWSGLAAILWVLHPVHTEAVSYISATGDTLYTLFCLWGVIHVLPDFSSRRMWGSVPIFMIALLSKESAIVFPALVMVAMFTTAQRSRADFKVYLRSWPLWLTAAMYLITRRTILDFNHSFDFYKTTNIYTESILIRFYTFLATLPSYLSLLFWPAQLHMDRSFPIFVEFWSRPVVEGAVILTVALALSTRSRWLAFAILWFFAAHSPHTGVLLPVNSLFLEHWLYLPTIGLFLVALKLVGEAKPNLNWRWLTGIIITILAALEAHATFQQNRVWQDPVTFYRNILQFEPVGTARVHNNLAMALGPNERGEAITHYRQAIALDDRYPQTHHNLGMLLLSENQMEPAIAEFQRAIELNANFFYSYKVLSDLYGQRGDRKSQEFYQQKFEETRNHFAQ